MSVALFTNNPLMLSLPHSQWRAFTEAGLQVVQAVTAQAESRSKFICVFLDTDARPVVTAARDCIHLGWRLLHHPLYGNYRPYQQPYRSLVLAAPGLTGGLDMASLHFIEEALLVYNNNKALAPAAAPVSLLEACALLDYELMRLPLEQSGVIPEGYVPASLRQGEELARNCA